MDGSRVHNFYVNNMGSHPINLAVRFLLELTALGVMGVWGWRQGDDWFRFVLAPGIPLIAAVIWGTFAVPDDPSRSGKAPVAVHGILQLLIEFFVFVFAVWALNDLGYSRLSLILGLLAGIHYMISYDRILWLIRQ